MIFWVGPSALLDLMLVHQPVCNAQHETRSLFDRDAPAAVHYVYGKDVPRLVPEVGRIPNDVRGDT